MTVIKYIVLVVMVIALPLYFLIVNGVVTPAFCKWLCPAGTLEGGVPLVIANEGLRAQLGWLFSWKALVTVAVVVASIFIYRPFCRFLCPLGAIYSLFNRTAVFGVRLDKKKCTHCGACARACKMDVRIVNDRECLRCGECVSRCPTGAISCKFIAPKGGKTHEETVRTGAHAGASHIRGAGDAAQPGHRGEEVSDFEVTLSDGSTFRLSDQRGKAVLVNLWATWCPPCVAEMPDLQKLSEDYADSLVVLGVNISDSAEDAAAFMEENGYTYPLYVDADYMLSTFIFPHAGHPAHRSHRSERLATAIHMGLGTYEQFQEYVDAALANVPAEAETESAEEAA